MQLRDLIGRVNNLNIKEPLDMLVDEFEVVSSKLKKLVWFTVVLTAMILGFGLAVRASFSGVQNHVVYLEKERDSHEARIAALEQRPIAQASVPVVIEPTSTSVAISSVAATPTPQRMEPKFRVEVANYGASTLGNGGFIIEWALVPVDKGMTKDEANNDLAKKTQAVAENCFAFGRNNTYHATSNGGKTIASFDGSSPIDQQCWSTLEKIAGVKASDKLPQKAVAALKKIASLGLRGNLFIQEDGKILGYWDWGQPPTGDCLEKGLREIGWDNAPYFTVSSFDDQAWNVLYNSAFAGWEMWGKRVPDLCESANLVPAAQPTWFKYSFEDDAHELKLEGLNVQIHSDPEQCRVFTRDWPKGQNLIEVNGKDVATVGPDDLIMVRAWIGDKEEMVYVTVKGSKISWYVPKGPGSDPRTFFQYVAAVQLSPSVDGRLSIRLIPAGDGQPSPYMIGDTVYRQNKAVSRTPQPR